MVAQYMIIYTCFGCHEDIIPYVMFCGLYCLCPIYMVNDWIPDCELASRVTKLYCPRLLVDMFSNWLQEDLHDIQDIANLCLMYQVYLSDTQTLYEVS